MLLINMQYLFSFKLQVNFFEAKKKRKRTAIKAFFLKVGIMIKFKFTSFLVILLTPNFSNI